MVWLYSTTDRLNEYTGSGKPYINCIPTKMQVRCNDKPWFSEDPGHKRYKDSSIKEKAALRRQNLLQGDQVGQQRENTQTSWRDGLVLMALHQSASASKRSPNARLWCLPFHKCPDGLQWLEGVLWQTGKSHELNEPRLNDCRLFALTSAVMKLIWGPSLTSYWTPCSLHTEPTGLLI